MMNPDTKQTIQAVLAQLKYILDLCEQIYIPEEKWDTLYDRLAHINRLKELQYRVVPELRLAIERLESVIKSLK